MAILVTGGSGFIGSNFLEYWLKNSGEKVVNLDKLTYSSRLDWNSKKSFAHDRYQFIQGDINDRALVRSILTESKITSVINFAAETHVDRSIDNAGAFLETNVKGTVSLLEECRAYLASVGAPSRFKFLHVSTDEVYGDLGPSDAPFSETTPYEPSSPYSASKAASDHFVKAFCRTYNLPVVVTNCSNNYGPYQNPEKLVPQVISSALAGIAIQLYGDGMQIRDWLFVEDHCSALAAVLERGRAGESYNIGGDSEATNKVVAESICDILDDLRPSEDGSTYRDQITFVKDRPGHDRRYAIDGGKIQRDLGWKPAMDFSAGLRYTVEWYLENSIWLNEHPKYKPQWLAQDMD